MEYIDYIEEEESGDYLADTGPDEPEDDRDNNTGGKSGTSDTLDDAFDIQYFGQRWTSDDATERIAKMYADMQSEKSFFRTRGENAFAAELETLLKTLVKYKYGQYSKRYGADMVQEAMLYCFQVRFQYSPDKGAFSTYFRIAADTAIKTYISTYIKHETRYESRVDAAVAKSIDKLGQTMDEDQVTPAMIEVDTGLSTAVVQAAMSRRTGINAPALSLDEAIGVQADGTDYDPVAAYNEVEVVRMFWEEARSLLRDRAYDQLVMHYVEGLEPKQICAKLGCDEKYRWAMERRALQKLAQSKIMRSFAGKSDAVSATEKYLATAGQTLQAIRQNMSSFFESNIDEGDSY